jgi:hypothetical protein
MADPALRGAWAQISSPGRATSSSGAPHGDGGGALRLVVTVLLEAEVAVLFVGSGVLGMLYYGTVLRSGGSSPPLLAPLLMVAAAAVELIAFPFAHLGPVMVR